MKLLLALSLITLALAPLPSLARSGATVGNGATAWTCRANSPERTLIWIEILDLSEARREFPGIQIPSASARSREEWIEFVGRKIWLANPEFHAEYAKRLQQVREQFTLVKDSDFHPTGDAYDRTRPQPKTCPNGQVSPEPEQLANFTHQGHLLVNDELWSSPALTEMDRAALFVHEAIYKLLRERAHATDSVLTREIVGYLLSELPVERYQDLLKLPASTATPAATESQAPVFGLYRAAVGDFADIDLTFYDPIQRKLYLTERNRDTGRELSSHVFDCETHPDAPLTCEMKGTSNWYIRTFGGVIRHRIRFDSDRSFVWMNQRLSGVTRATRYQLPAR